MAKIGIVTVLYNSEGVLEEFFRTLDEQTFKDFTLYVIDNASKDNSLKKAIELSNTVSFKTVFFPEKENWGIAKGNNIGIKAALNDKCDYVLLSNNDIVLNHRETIEMLYDKIKNTDIGIITPKLLFYQEPHNIWFGGGKFADPAFKIFHWGYNEPDNGQYDNEKLIDYTPTCFTLIQKFVFDKIGFMDESYFVYWDDTDFMYRIKINGIKVLYYPQTSILHNESFSTGNGSDFKIYQIARNQLLYVRKFFSTSIFYYIIFRALAVHFLKHTFTYTKSQRKAERRGIFNGYKLSYKKSLIK